MLPEPSVPEVTSKTGFMLRLPLESAVRELARLRSKLIAIGVEPTVMGLLKVTLPVIGPEIVACTAALVVGSMYITVAEPMVMVALV